MGHKSKKSLVHQVKEVLQTKLHAGESKHLAKQEYGCKTLADCRQHVDAYLQYRASYCSPYTVKLDAAAIGKTFGESTTNFVHTPSRIRSEVTRSRGEKGMDKHFSEVKNSNLVDFCRATGLRRSEVKVCTGNALVTCASSPVGLGIHVESGKGGRERIAPLYCDRSTAEKIVSLCEQAGDRRIFDSIHKAADIHGYRAEYAERVYTANARPLDTLFRPEKYYCRNDKAGCVYDRQALQATTNALGHNRIDVAASNYLYNVR